MRLSALDALNYYCSQGKYGTYFGGGDMVSIMVFDSGAESPSLDRLRSALAARIELIPALRERIAAAPGNVSYPHWVLDPTPPETKFIEMAGHTWDEVLAGVRQLPLDRVDSQESTWRGYVWSNVAGVPGVPDRATVIALKVSHALIDGRGLTQIQRALFGDDAAIARIPGHGNATRTARGREVAAELVRTPWNLAKLVKAERSASAPAPSGEKFCPVPELNGQGKSFAFLDVQQVPVSDLRWGGTVTETGLAATSIALENFLDKLGAKRRPLSAQLPVVPPGLDTLDLPVPSGNCASLGVVVDLGIGTFDPADRAEHIRRSLADKIANEASQQNLANRERFERLPVQVVRKLAERSTHITQVPWHVGLTSHSKGTADLSLLGHRLVFLVGLPMLRPGLGIAQKLIGFGDEVTVSIAASNAVPQPEVYAELLHAAIRREI